ncbi:hypothetical protein YC2023_068734 [Brassica napus]
MNTLLGFVLKTFISSFSPQLQDIAKQTIVLKVNMSGKKYRNKAMKIVVGTSGVTGVRLEKDKETLTVEGEGVDVLALARALEKKVGKTEIIKVS